MFFIRELFYSILNTYKLYFEIEENSRKISHSSTLVIDANSSSSSSFPPDISDSLGVAAGVTYAVGAAAAAKVIFLSLAISFISFVTPSSLWPSRSTLAANSPGGGAKPPGAIASLPVRSMSVTLKACYCYPSSMFTFVFGAISVSPDLPEMIVTLFSC